MWQYVIIHYLATYFRQLPTTEPIPGPIAPSARHPLMALTAAQNAGPRRPLRPCRSMLSLGTAAARCDGVLKRWEHDWLVIWNHGILWLSIQLGMSSSHILVGKDNWLVSDMNFIFPYIGKNHPKWLLYFSNMTFICFIICGNNPSQVTNSMIFQRGRYTTNQISIVGMRWWGYTDLTYNYGKSPFIVNFSH